MDSLYNVSRHVLNYESSGCELTQKFSSTVLDDISKKIINGEFEMEGEDVIL